RRYFRADPSPLRRAPESMTAWLRSFLIVALAPALLAGQPAKPRRAPANDAITAAKMRADLEFLAGDGLCGRLTDTPENAIALDWVKARFQWLGLKPMGAKGSYFLPYDLS